MLESFIPPAIDSFWVGVYHEVAKEVLLAYQAVIQNAQGDFKKCAG